MRKHILFPPVAGVKIAIARKPGEAYWEAHIINDNDVEIRGVIIVSRGYGEKSGNEGEKQTTSTLRHLFNEIPPRSSAMIEPIDAQLFHLFNEFWVSYYIDKQIYDKKFIFVPDSIIEQNMVYIPQISTSGVLHS